MTENSPPLITGSAEIPPMPFGFALDRIYRIVRGHSKVFLGIAVPPAVVTLLVYGVMFGVMFAKLRPYLTLSGGPLGAVAAEFAIMRILFPSILIAMVPIIVVFAFYLAAAFHASNKIDSGTATTVRESFRMAWGGLGRSLGLFLWIYLRAFAPLLALEIVSFGFSGWMGVNGNLQGPPSALWAFLPVIWVLFIAAYVYGVIVALRLCLAFPASIEEGLTAREAIRRSSQLTMGSKGRIFLLMLVIYAITYAFMFVLYMVGAFIGLMGAVAMMALNLRASSPWGVAGIGLAVVILICILYVWIALLYASMVVTLSVVYHDQRRRKDAPHSIQLPVPEDQLLPPGAEPA